MQALHQIQAKDAMKRFAKWLFSGLPIPTTAWSVVKWWESRRIAFNVIVGVYGLVCLIVYLSALGASGHLRPGEDAVEPLALVAAPFAINALYTLGWLVEVPARLVRPDLTPRFGVRLLQLGLGLGLFLITLPAGLWVSIRILQVLGIAK